MMHSDPAPSGIPQGDSLPVLLVDDHDIWRRGLASMLQGSEFAVVAEARSTREALPAARAARPKVTLLDIRLLDGDGFETLDALRSEFPQMPVVMLTTYESPTFKARAVAAGAAGYLLKGITRAELLEALRAVTLRGETLLKASDLVRSLKGVSERASSSPELFTPLSPREEEVLRLVATGLPNREIAQVLCIAEGTVKTHVGHILNKLGAMDRVQMAVWAARNGLAGTERRGQENPSFRGCRTKVNSG